MLHHDFINVPSPVVVVAKWHPEGGRRSTFRWKHREWRRRRSTFWLWWASSLARSRATRRNPIQNPIRYYYYVLSVGCLRCWAELVESKCAVCAMDGNVRRALSVVLCGPSPACLGGRSPEAVRRRSDFDVCGLPPFCSLLSCALSLCCCSCCCCCWLVARCVLLRSYWPAAAAPGWWSSLPSALVLLWPGATQGRGLCCSCVGLKLLFKIMLLEGQEICFKFSSLVFPKLIF